MRNDFYAPLDALAPDLMNAAVPGLCNIPAMLSRPELKEIINRPAAAVGLPLEAGLADRIVNDILDTDPTARQATVTLLPALEVALRQLRVRRRREDGSLTHAAYEKIGKVTGSLTAWCNRALGQLPADQHPTAQRILTALVRPANEANGIPATRRPASLTRLRALTANPKLTGPAADAAFDAVLAALTRYRIVTTGTTPLPARLLANRQRNSSTTRSSATGPTCGTGSPRTISSRSGSCAPPNSRPATRTAAFPATCWTVPSSQKERSGLTGARSPPRSSRSCKPADSAGRQPSAVPGASTPSSPGCWQSP